MRPKYYCDECPDPDESCQYDGTWQGIVTFHCPDCDTDYEIPEEHFDANGDYIGESTKNDRK